MKPKYIIVQAGGKGSRMETLTQNKPKALVPVENLPMIFHLFKKFPDKKYLIIGDYKEDVLRRYLSVFADADYRVVSANGRKGTVAGIKDAMSFIPSGESFMLIWCDLILGDDDIPDIDADVIGIAKNFSCRWSYMHTPPRFLHEEIPGRGIAGYFIFKDKASLSDLPEEGEFVRYLRDNNHSFAEHTLNYAREYGLYSEWAKLPRMRCRPFNRITVKEDKIIKEGIDEQGRSLAKKEIAWYEKIKDAHFKNIPHIYKTSPLTMEFINGKNIYEYNLLPLSAKQQILAELILCLKEVHAIGSVPADKESFFDAYIGKTYKRLEKVRKLTPFANDETVIINGKPCRNIFYCKDKIEELVWRYCPKEFQFIHGDPTFSNILLRNDFEPVLIDPRGYFGNIQFYGDPAYDWVKLYYSLFSNYDQFNLKRFRLQINDNDVTLDVSSNGWEALEPDFFRLLKDEVTPLQMKLFLALTWLSLTTYAWEDYDSICGAFYRGLWYLEEALELENAGEYSLQNEKNADTLLLSTLGHTWILDLDGTIVKHNGYIDGSDEFLPGALEFLQNIPPKDKIIFITSRKESERPHTERFLSANNVRFDAVIFDAPMGERILLNDDKPSGLSTALALRRKRDEFTPIRIVEDANL